MKTSVEKLNPTRAKITITVSPEDLKPAIAHAYEHIAEQVNIPGFRKGKVPAPIIDQRVGRPAVLEHAVNEGLDGFYNNAVVENKLRPIGRPEADVVKLPEVKDFSGDLVVEVEVNVRPEIKVPAFDTLRVEVEAADASADDIADELDRLRQRFGTLVSVDRPAKKGDFLQLNLNATIGDTQVDTAEGISYELGSGELIEGIDDAIDSLTAGETTTFESTLLGGDHEGEKAQIEVTVTSVKERELPKADDDFAQIASEFDTITELKDSLKEQVKNRKTVEQAREAGNKAVAELIKKIEVPIPEGFVEDEVHRHLEGEGRLEDDVHRKEVTEETEQTYKQQVILDTIAEANGVQVGQDELLQYVFQAAPSYGMAPEDFLKALTDNNQIGSLVSEIARNKAIDFILAGAKIVDSKGKNVDLSSILNPAVVEDAKPASEKKPAAKKAPAKKPADKAAAKK